MSTVKRYFQAAAVVLFLTSFSLAGDPPNVATNTDWMDAVPGCQDRPGQRADELGTAPTL